MQPCEQADNIRNISEHLLDIKDSLKEQTAIIRSVADQNARISALEKSDDHNQGNFTEIYNRMRVTDRKVDRAQTFIGVITGKTALAVISALLFMIIAGSVCDVTYHWQMMKTIFGVVK